VENLIKLKEKESSLITLDDDEEDILEKNMVWIFGMHRSGTTWLAKNLLSHQTLLWNEPTIGHILGISRLPNIVNGKLTEDQATSNPDRFFYPKYKNNLRNFLRKLILGRAFAQFQEFKKKIIIKEPNGSIGADIICESLPKSKIIIVIRDCRDVVDSVVDGISKDGYRANRIGWSLSEHNKMDFITVECETIVKTWEVLDKTFENHPSELRYKIKYENLLKNTYEELLKIYNFLGITIKDDILNEIITKSDFKQIPEEKRGKGKLRRLATPGKWKENFDQKEIDLMNEILENTLKRLGYSI